MAIHALSVAAVVARGVRLHCSRTDPRRIHRSGRDGCFGRTWSR